MKTSSLRLIIFVALTGFTVPALASSLLNSVPTIDVLPASDVASSITVPQIDSAPISQDGKVNESIAVVDAAVSAMGQRLQPGLRLMPALPNMMDLQDLLPNWSLLDEFGRSLLPITEDLLTDVEKKALNLVRCRFLNAQHAELNYGVLEPRQAAAATGINVHVICPLGQSFGLLPAHNNQPVEAYQIQGNNPEQPSMKIQLLDISGKPIQDMTYSGTGRVETVQLIGLLQSSDGNTTLPAGEVRLPAGSSVLIKLP